MSFFDRALDPFGLALICGLFRHPSRPKIDTYFSRMCNFLLKMRLRQAVREIAWRPWKPWRRLLKLSSASPGVGSTSFAGVSHGRYRSQVRAPSERYCNRTEGPNRRLADIPLKRRRANTRR
jgi:hypothetical protein